MASPQGREVNWNTCDLWQNLRYFLLVLVDGDVEVGVKPGLLLAPPLVRLA